MKTSISAVLTFFISLFLSIDGVVAQRADGQRMTPEERKAYADKLRVASPVYTLLGKKGIGTPEMPAPDVALIDGELAFRNHEGGHVDSLDWPVFLTFAERQFKNSAIQKKK